ncbi:MAG: protease modulator HflC [Halobacteriovoraceae bacterium]|jgi:membrane protease subunit HflC|nr:protease modulator HflC [Halobacteriovoraceae bacterium]
MGNKAVIFGAVLLVGIIAFNSIFFELNEGRQAIITQFGKPVGDPITSAGLHIKTPFIQEVRYVDKRILSWDGYPNQIPTKDKKYIKVDTTARWRVVDALKFIQTVRNESGAKRRLDTILDSITRDIISSHNLVEAVRNSNGIIQKTEEKKAEIKRLKAAGKPVLEEEITGEIEPIKVGREKLSDMIVESATKELEAFGINLVDVQLRRISYEKSVEAKVYERMISERQRIAQKIRSIGQGEKAKIEGRLERDLREIRSQAYKESQIIKGKGQAKAVKIYASSLSQDPKFYQFLKTMEVYRNSIQKRTKFIMSSDGELFKFFKKIN